MEPQPDLERSEQVVARVLAWHHRHPLATRIRADQVHSVGVVSLPFAVRGAQVQAVAEAAADAEPSARVRWQVSGLPPRRPPWHPLAWVERLRGRSPYRALFSEDFIAPLPLRRVTRWAAAHGSADRPLPPGAAQRLVMLDPSLRRAGDGAAAEVDLHLITAAIAIGDQRHRLLLAPGAGGAVLGRRHWSRQRALSALPLLAGLLVAAGAAWQLRAPAAAAPLLAAASAPVAALVPPAKAEAAADEASAPSSPAANPVETPPAAEARAGTVELPPLPPRLDEQQRRELRAAGRALRQERVVAAKAWALVTPLLRDRRQSERAAAQLQAVALLQPVPMQTELLSAGRGWRAVFWPFSSEQDAQKVRLALADKGLQTELLEF